MLTRGIQNKGKFELICWQQNLGNKDSHVGILKKEKEKNQFCILKG